MDKNKMLIDATHPEETRVVALRNGRVEEFDFESAARKLLRGNIYLAKVTRVEPSLQAAFIDYGGNRHGFLAFNEIHPDYYQIPVADREALKQEEAEAERAEEEADERARSRGPRRRRRGRGERPLSNGNGNGYGDGDAPPGHRGAVDEPAAEIDTFEDGYQTSGASHGDEPGEAGSSAATLRHSDAADDVRHHEPEHRPAAGDWQPDVPADEPAPDMRSVSTSGSAEPPSLLGDWSEPASGESAHSIAPAGGEVYEAPVPGYSDRSPGDEGDEPAPASGATLEDDQVEQIATEDDALEELPERPRRRARQYKIQEVIKRRQIMLVQVVKEERGNKGAALTTYISLAGRYTVLMPNTARGGGISRKITQPQDRKRLKAIAEELDVQEGMGLIIRTAGAARTKQEIKRDYDYLIRLWESVRDLTLSSTAPCLVYEEGNIIKRAIRDLYSKDFDQIVVAGDAAHREAQDFMEMLMPGSGSHVASYRAPEPLFARYGIERQLNALFSPYVTLRSGGYIVINQTEALVSVDVNSGKSTREFSIEETALNTNLEAADEIARQLKLRDLAGLIVVDFIDMEEKRNNRSVERRLKDALRHDRARIQIGRISHFGLLEMSRQRLRAGVLEGSTSQCPHCQGTGIIRSIESVALAVLRGLEDHLLKQPSSLAATATAEVALYILNHKRAYITEMERRHGVTIRVEASERMQGANFGVERIAAPVALARPASRTAVSMEWGFDRDEEAGEEVDALPAEPVARERAASPDPDERPGPQKDNDEDRRGRRRRRRRGRRDREDGSRDPQHVSGGQPPEDHEVDDIAAPVEPLSAGSRETPREAPVDEGAGGEAEVGEAIGAEGDRTEDSGEAGDPPRRGRRRGRRGGRARRRDGGEGQAPAPALDAEDGDRHEWGIAEVARPGAEQPSAEVSAHRHESALGLVASVEVPDRARAHVDRPTIVESIGATPASQPDSFDASSAEALHRAVALASPALRLVPSAPPEAAPAVPEPAPEAPATVVKAPPAAPIRVVPVEIVARTEAAEPPPAQPDDSNGGDSRDGAQRTAGEGLSERTAAEPELSSAEEPSRPSRRGWWQRRFGGTE